MVDFYLTLSRAGYRQPVSDLIALTLNGFEGSATNSGSFQSDAQMIGEMLIVVDAGVGSAPHLTMSVPQMLSAIAIGLGSTSSDYRTQSEEQLVADIIVALGGTASASTMSWLQLWQLLATTAAGGVGVRIVLSASTIAENSANATVLGTASINGSFTGTPSWGIVDATGTFQINASTGQITVLDNTDLNFEINPTIAITVTVSGTTPDPANRAFTITVTDVANPIITSSVTASVAENAQLAHGLTANEAVTWSIVGGADEFQFDLSGSTLIWVANGTQNFEAPADADANNVYIVTVRATSNATSEFTDQTISITVTDVAEGGGNVGSPIGLLLVLTKAA